MIRGSPGNPMSRLVGQLTKLPGVGNRSAQRMAFHLLKASDEEVKELAAAMVELKRDVRPCSVCGDLTRVDPCAVCSDPRRDRGTILVVEQPSDVATIEGTGAYHGMYHVLMGRLAPMDGVGPGELNIHGLISRVKAGGVREVIIGTNPTLEGDGTSLYLAGELEPMGVRVTRLARGLPTGYSLESASKAVLTDAVQGRRAM